MALGASFYNSIVYNKQGIFQSSIITIITNSSEMWACPIGGSMVLRKSLSLEVKRCGFKSQLYYTNYMNLNILLHLDFQFQHMLNEANNSYTLESYFE